MKLKSLPEPSEISSDDVIIDGLFGTGLNRPPTGSSADAIDWINLSRRNGAKVIAIDVPSGLNASNGSTRGCCKGRFYSNVLVFEAGLLHG